MRISALVLSLCMALLPTLGIAKNCTGSDIVYESDPDNRGDNNTPFTPSTLRFDGPDVLLTADGKTTRYSAAGSAGSGIPVFVVAPESGEPVSYRILSLTRITNPDEPDHVLIFNNDLYWPVCKRSEAAQPAAEPAETPRKVVFSDEFEGSDLSKDWEVSNPNGDYVVEKGSVLAVASVPGGLANPDIPNTFKLIGDLPSGDYTVTAKLNVAFATGAENFAVGLFDDKDNYLTASLLGYGSCCNAQRVYLKMIKVSGGQPTEFEKTVFDFESQHTMTFDQGANAVAQPITLKLVKEGRNFSASVNFAGQKDDAGNPVWVTTEAVTSLRPPKTLVMNASQTDKVSGETKFTVDSITIDVPSDSAQ